MDFILWGYNSFELTSQDVPFLCAFHSIMLPPLFFFFLHFPGFLNCGISLFFCESRIASIPLNYHIIPFPRSKIGNQILIKWMTLKNLSPHQQSQVKSLEIYKNHAQVIFYLPRSLRWTGRFYYSENQDDHTVSFTNIDSPAWPYPTFLPSPLPFVTGQCELP